MVYNIPACSARLRGDSPRKELTMEQNQKRIYADNAATTAVSPEGVAAMLPCFQTVWGNPSSLHYDGQIAKEMLTEAREKIAKALPLDIRPFICIFLLRKE